MFQDLTDVCGWAVTAADSLSWIRRQDADSPPGVLACRPGLSLESGGGPRGHLAATVQPTSWPLEAIVAPVSAGLSGRAGEVAGEGVSHNGASSWQGG